MFGQVSTKFRSFILFEYLLDVIYRLQILFDPRVNSYDIHRQGITNDLLRLRRCSLRLPISDAAAARNDLVSPLWYSTTSAFVWVVAAALLFVPIVGSCEIRSR